MESLTELSYDVLTEQDIQQSKVKTTFVLSLLHERECGCKRRFNSACNFGLDEMSPLEMQQRNSLVALDPLHLIAASVHQRMFYIVEGRVRGTYTKSLWLSSFCIRL